MSQIGTLRQGVARQEFSVHYQHKWDLKTGRLAGVEALLRWTGGELGCVAPHEFIPVAEKSSLICEFSGIAQSVSQAPNNSGSGDRRDHGASHHHFDPIPHPGPENGLTATSVA